MKIIVIGGGISGVAFAIKAAQKGIDVLILEKKNRVLKKMLATGNGRCNFTNISVKYENFHSVNNKEFHNYAISKFNNENLIEFLKSLGIEHTIENKGKIFPITLKASSIVNSLLKEMNRLGVQIFVDCEVISINKGKRFIVKTLENEYIADKVVFSVGGCSMPNSGSDGKSYKILENLGHNKTKLFPGITQIKLNSQYLKQLSGLKIIGNVKLLNKDNEIANEFGDLLFTNYGISGPPILNLSRTVNVIKNDLFLELPLINNIKNYKEMEKILKERFYFLQEFSLEDWLMGIVDKKLINFITNSLKIDKELKMKFLNEESFKNLITFLLKCRFQITGTTGFENSQVTCGGIDTKEINEKTFESKLIKNLYVVGEVMDIDGDCGGYNIQWAFTSGILAADSINI